MSGNEAAWRLPEDMGAAELLRKLAGDLLLGDAALYDYLGYGHEGFWGAEKGGVSICRTLESLADMVERELLLVELCGLLGIPPIGLIDVSEQELLRVGKRVMPEGVEWPRYETGEPVKLGGSVEDEDGDEAEVAYITFHEDHVELGLFNGVETYPVVIDHGDRVKRPAPEVLDADGVEIRAGDTVYDMVGDRHEVKGFGKQGDVLLEFHNDESLGWRPSNFTHRAPVLAADGEPLEVGQTVYAKNYGYVKCTVLAIEWVVDGYLVEVENEGGHKFRQTSDEFTHRAPVLAADGLELRVGETVYDTEDRHGYPHTVVSTELDGLKHVKTTCEEPKPASVSIHPSRLTHEQPDSWKRLEEDCGMFASEYAEKIDLNKEAGGWGVPVRRDLVRRAKKLAGVER